MDAKQAAAYAAKLENDLVEQTWTSLNNDRSRESGLGKFSGPATAPQQSMDELTADLKRHPFFATSLSDLGEDNVAFDALQALAYEGTRVEIAENFREQGNDSARLKDWTNAKEFYGKALAAIRGDRRKDELNNLNKQAEGWDEREAKKEIGIKEKCLTNRALCHLNLGNYRSCCLDCVGALEIGPRNIKAHYRLAQALYSLSRLDEAARAVAAGLIIDGQNSSLLQLKEEIDNATNVHDNLDRKRKAEMERRSREAKVLSIALQARQVKMRLTPNPPDLEDAKIALTPDPFSPTSSLVFPVLVLYPLHGQSDFIKSFNEKQTIMEHIEYLLPLPWDEKEEYGGSEGEKVDAYLETSQGGLVKWGKKVELLRLLSGGKVEVVNSVVTVSLVPSSRATDFIDNFKQRKNR